VRSDPVIASKYYWPPMKHEDVPEFAKKLVHITGDEVRTAGPDELEEFADALCGINKDNIDIFHNDMYLFGTCM